jgi:hypothetical protein
MAGEARHTPTGPVVIPDSCQYFGGHPIANTRLSKGREVVIWTRLSKEAISTSSFGTRAAWSSLGKQQEC